MVINDEVYYAQIIMRILEETRKSRDHVAKMELFDVFAEIASALSTGRRGEIIDILAQGERSVDELSNELEQSIANTSHHLRTLARAGLVRSRRDGTRIFYRLSSERVEMVWAELQRTAETLRADLYHLAESYLGDLGEIQPIGRSELLRKLSEGSILVIDVRPEREFQSGHITGAVSIPVDELPARLKELPKNRVIAVYCRGPYCAFAPEAARFLKENGYEVSRLEDGFPEWRREGLPTEFGA